MTKKDVYVVVDTPKKAKKLKKVLDMFNEPISNRPNYKNSGHNGTENGWGYGISDGKWQGFNTKWVGLNGKEFKKVSIKELRNILAKEHLKEADFIIATIGKTEYVAKVESIWNNEAFINSHEYLCINDELKHNVQKHGSFTGFKRYATTEEIALLEPKPKELGVGKWYKKVNKKGEVFIFNHQKNGKSYGWFKGRWVDNDWLTDCFFDYILLDTKEVESALIEEAKRRGFDYDDFVFEDLTNILWDNYDSDIAGKEEKALFNNGKWAEVIDKFAELKESHKNKEVVEFRREKTNNEWLDFFQNTPSWLNDPEYPIKPQDPVKVGDWMLNPNSKKITQVKKENHGKSLIGSGWIKIKDTELVEKLNSL